jgi:ABC-type multidrug transport system ATPase subunit
MLLRAVSVDGSLAGYENLPISARLYGIPHGEQKARICLHLDFVGLKWA